MYDAFYGLADRPFQLTPDPRFWCETSTHRKAMAYLGYGLAQGEGFIVITGDIGAGKTTLVGHLTAQIDPANLNVITIVSTAVEHEDLLRIVAQGLNLDPAGKTKAELLMIVERGLHAVARTGRRTLLIVDEAQALPPSALEELRMLSNFQAGGRALVQIFLLGQPEFRERLNGSDRLEQLRQRVIAVHHLDPMAAEEVEDYVTHRLTVAGWTGRPAFSADAFAALHRATGGVPRRLNQLMTRVLLHGSLAQAETIDAALIAGVVADEERDLPAPRADAPATPRPAATVANDAAATPLTRADPQTEARIAALEARIAEQDAALRRVLTLLVDWVEGDAARAEAMRGAA
ncbi:MULTISPECIES: ExeA family protein [Sphingomonas]|jgi:putative secretion ATPase (PEP-CTERM system associated)|uniref:ExeA family protein n=1 Tax=Sphingomonas TaxID=13687 RepID=UPI0008351CD1|nr:MULTISPECIES: AAA family ATPase [Sphingomonas]MBY0302598.1 AAA family ATPase [Sphingomonas ginsenosidimutans]